MKSNKSIIICALMVLMVLICANTVSAEDALNANLTSEANDIIASDSVDEVVASTEAGEALAADDSSEVLSESGDILYIDCNYEGETESGTADAPFKSITNAMEEVTGGETLYLKNGFYAIPGDKIGNIQNMDLTVVGESDGGVTLKAVPPNNNYNYMSAWGFVTIKGTGCLTLTNLTFLAIPQTINNCAGHIIQVYGEADCVMTNITIKDSGLSRTIYITSSGQVNITNLRLVNNTYSDTAYPIDLSGAGEVNIKDSVIDNNRYVKYVNEGAMADLIAVTKGRMNLDNVSICNNSITPNQNKGLFYVQGNLTMVNCKIKNNTVKRMSSTELLPLFCLYGTSSNRAYLNIQQSVISGNNALYLSKKQGGQSAIVNYCNINNNNFTKAYIFENYGTNNFDSNWWGDNEPPEQSVLEYSQAAPKVILNNWVVGDENYVYTLNDGSELEKVIPELPGLEPVGSSVVIDPIENVIEGNDVVITYSVENETAVSIVVKDSNGNEITDGVDTSVAGQVTVSNLDVGMYTIAITNAETGTIFGSSDSQTFRVLSNQNNVTLVATSRTVRVDQNATVNVVLNETAATGTVIINIDGVDYSAEVVDGAADITLPFMPAGKTTLDVFYTGDGLFNNATTTVTVNVNKYPITLKATAATVRVGNDVTVKVTLSKTDATGPVSITVNGNEFTATASAGKANVVLSGLPVGQYALDVNYEGDARYKACSGVVTFNVNKIPTTLKATAATVRVGNDVTVNVVISKTGATGPVSIVANGNEFTANATNGKASVILSGLPVGQYSLDVNYLGDENYKPCSGVVTFNVNKIPTTLKATARTVHVGEDVTVNVVLSKTDATGIVSIVANGEEFTAVAQNGKANIVISGLPTGQYSLDVNYLGYGNYKPCSGIVTFNVNKWKSTMEASACAVHVGENAIVNVQLDSDATGEAIITIDGVDYVGTVEDGVASIIIPNLPAGEYSLKVTYTGDDKYKSTTADVDFNVNKNYVRMKATARTVKVGNDVVVNVALSDDATGEVVINANGNNYTATVTDGTAVVVIPGLPVGQYALDVNYSGDDKYRSYTGKVTFNVNA